MHKHIFNKVLFPLFGIVFLISIWGICCRFVFEQASYFPSPSQTLTAIISMWKEGYLITDILSSFQRILIGFVLAMAMSLILGITVYRFSNVYLFLKGAMGLLSSIPPIAWTPIAILWFGLGDKPAYFIVFLGAFFPLFTNVYAGITSVDREMIDAAKTLGANDKEIAAKIIFPGSLPRIFTGIKIGLNIAWFNVIAAELIGAKSGLGYRIEFNRELLASDNVIGTILIIGIIGLLMNGFTSLIANIAIPWSLQNGNKEKWVYYHQKIKKLFSGNKISPPGSQAARQVSPFDFSKPLLDVEQLSFSYKNDGTHEISLILKDISFKIKQGEVVSIVGPNGCGKTTLIQILAGLLRPDFGKINFEDVMINTTSNDRTVVFQNFALFPWMTSRENIEFAIRNRASEKNEMADSYFKQAGLENYTDYYPFQLSGGMKQRLAIMRAIAANPKLILMDEPFASFDPLIRNKSQETILQLLKERENATVLIVTHDIDEAIFMSDKIVILSPKPTIVKEIINITLPRPRTDSLRITDEFIEYRNLLWTNVRENENLNH